MKVEMRKESGSSSNWAKKILILGLCFAVGWANVMSFVQYKTFGTMMTGNLIRLGVAISLGNGWEALYVFLVMVAFCVGASIYHFICIQVQSKNWSIKSKSPAMISPLVLILGLGQDLWIYYGPEDEYKQQFGVLFLSLTLGIVCAIAAKVNGVACNVYSGHLTKLNKGCFDFLFQRKVFQEKSRAPALLSAQALASFLGGLVWGSVLVKYILKEDFINYKHADFGFFVPVFTSLGFVFAFLLVLHDDQAPGGQKLARNGVASVKRRAIILEEHMIVRMSTFRASVRNRFSRVSRFSRGSSYTSSTVPGEPKKTQEDLLRDKFRFSKNTINIIMEDFDDSEHMPAITGENDYDSEHMPIIAEDSQEYDEEEGMPIQTEFRRQSTCQTELMDDSNRSFGFNADRRVLKEDLMDEENCITDESSSSATFPQEEVNHDAKADVRLNIGLINSRTEMTEAAVLRGQHSTQLASTLKKEGVPAMESCNRARNASTPNEKVSTSVNKQGRQKSIHLSLIDGEKRDEIPRMNEQAIEDTGIPATVSAFQVSSSNLSSSLVDFAGRVNPTQSISSSLSSDEDIRDDNKTYNV